MPRQTVEMEVVAEATFCSLAGNGVGGGGGGGVSRFRNKLITSGYQAMGGN